MHESPEIVDERASVVLGTGVVRQGFRQRIDGCDISVQGCRVKGNWNRGFLERGQFRLDPLSLLFELAMRCRASSSEMTYRMTRSMLRCRSPSIRSRFAC
ncbi:hypothetical protein [Bradyrhizobium sp.]|uniref:hypothetical protein n=1 Tax=Bradyrhizobium sp. TaxID=376 RepID=UPI00039ECB6D